MKYDIKEFSTGECFIYKNNFWIMDEDCGVVQLTGKNAGRRLSYFFNNYPKRVEFVQLDMEVIE